MNFITIFIVKHLGNYECKLGRDTTLFKKCKYVYAVCTNTCILSRTYQTIVIFRYSFILRDEFLFFEESQLTVSFLNITECI